MTDLDKIYVFNQILACKAYPCFYVNESDCTDSLDLTVQHSLYVRNPNSLKQNSLSNLQLLNLLGVNFENGFILHSARKFLNELLVTRRDRYRTCLRIGEHYLQDYWGHLEKQLRYIRKTGRMHSNFHIYEVSFDHLQNLFSLINIDKKNEEFFFQNSF